MAQKPTPKAKTPKIDPEFRDFLPAPNAITDEDLRKSIIKDGVLQPLIVWEEKGILVDGHRRKKIAEELKVPYRTKVLSFKNREEVLLWMVNHQVGRRNLTPKELSFYRGQEYLTKQAAQKNANPDEPKNVAAEVAEKHGVSERTIHRDANFAEQINAAPDKAAALKAASGKLHCERCERVGPTKGCAACKELKAKAGKKPTFNRSKASGEVKFEWTSFNFHLGKVVRSIDEIVKEYPAEKNSSDHEVAADLAERFVKVMAAWQRRMTGK